MHDEQEEFNPLEPFSGSVSGKITNIPWDAIDCASRFFKTWYEDDPKLLSAADKAFSALAQGYTILDNGEIEVRGSASTYIVGGECRKKGASKRNPKTGGVTPVYCPSYAGGRNQCYHMVAAEIIRLAQVFITPSEQALEVAA